MALWLLAQTLSRLFQFVKNVKDRRFSLELISYGPHVRLERERKICLGLFTSPIKREIRHFHVVVVQWRQRNVQKKRDARAKLLFFHVIVAVAVVVVKPPY